MKQKKVIYYKDVHNDEFSDAVIEPIRIDEKDKYIRDGFVGKFTVSHGHWGPRAGDCCASHRVEKASDL